MKTLFERVDGFAQKKLKPVKRGGASYAATYNHCKGEIERLVQKYQALKTEDQTARLTRDSIEQSLRRYQNYCIKENFGAHYREQGLDNSVKVEFEHVLPVRLARDLLLANRLTVGEALNVPTCWLSAVNHKRLNSTKLGSTTPDIYWFWRRYQDLDISIETHSGVQVDTAAWNLSTHYEYFPIDQD